MATCCEVEELPWLSPATPLPMMPATLALDPAFAKAPLFAEATPPKRATAKGRAATAAMTRAVPRKHEQDQMNLVHAPSAPKQHP